MNDARAELVVVFSGRSEIGAELAVQLAPGACVVRTAQGTNGLDGQTHAIRAAGAAAVYIKVFDADDLASHRPLLD